MAATLRSSRDLQHLLSTYQGAELALVRQAIRDEQLDRRPRWSRRLRRRRTLTP